MTPKLPTGLLLALLLSASPAAARGGDPAAGAGMGPDGAAEEDDGAAAEDGSQDDGDAQDAGTGKGGGTAGDEGEGSDDEEPTPRSAKDRAGPRLAPRTVPSRAPVRAPGPVAPGAGPGASDAASGEPVAPTPVRPDRSPAPAGGPAAAGDDDATQGDDDDGGPGPWAGDEDAPAPASQAEAPRRSVEPLPSDANLKISINYDDVEIKDIIKDFAYKTGRNFLVDGGISGKITIHAPHAVGVDDAYEAFIIALDSAGYTTVVEARFSSGPNKGKPMLTRILGTDAAKSEPLELMDGERALPPTAHLVTRLVQLENVSADEMSRVIQKWISKDGDMVAYAPSNTLIITDSANNIRRIAELIQELDISAPRQKLEVIEIQHAEAQAVLSIIQEIYGTDAAGRSSGSSTSTTGRTASQRGAAARDRKTTTGGTTAGATSAVGEESSFIGKMIADERTNSIIVLATEKSLVEIRDLIARIDYEVDPFAQADIHVIYLEYAKAEELSSTLNSLIQQSNTRTTQRTTGSSARGGAASRSSSAAEGAAEKAPSVQGGQPGSLGGNFAGEVRVTHDVPTNALVVTAGRDDYSRLKRVVELLDIPRKQVFVETVIMEVSDQKVKDNGVSWHGGLAGETNSDQPVSMIGARGGTSISPAASLLDGSLLAGLGLGIFGEAIKIPVPGVEGGMEIPAFGVVLRFLQEDSATNVLSSPNILTLDNEEATIEIGETVPFPTSSYLGSLASAATAATSSLGYGGYPSISYSREDVGILLRLTPQINESDWVTLDVLQEISEVKEGSTSDSASSGGPTTTKRSAETHVSVRSNQTVVIGGLMQEVETESESKIPILGDIPLIGGLFRNKRKTVRKTNLLIFLTPHVIDGPEDLQEIYTVKMLQREEFMRRFYGKTPEQQIEELNALIRYSMNLPGQPPVYSESAGGGRPDVSIEGVTEPISDEELRRAIRGLDDTSGSVLITPQGEVGIEPDEEDDGEPDEGGEQDGSDPSDGGDGEDPASDGDVPEEQPE